MSEDRPVVVGVDGSPDSRRALLWAADYARVSGRPLQALTAWDVPTGYGMPALFDDLDLESRARETLAEAVTDALGGSVSVSLRVERGHGAAVLVAASAGAGLLVVGSRGHGGFVSALLGSVSQYCTHHADCPVVVVRGDARP